MPASVPVVEKIDEKSVEVEAAPVPIIVPAAKEVTAEVASMQVSGGSTTGTTANSGSGGNKSNRRNKKESKVEATDKDSSSGSKSFADLVRGWEPAKEGSDEPKIKTVPVPKKTVIKEEVKPTVEADTSSTPAAKSGKKQAMPTQTSIYVHNVPVGIRQRELREIFGVFGKILRIDCHSDRGFAFVNFESPEIVKATLKVENIKCNGSTLRIESRDRANDGLSKVPSPHEHGVSTGTSVNTNTTNTNTSGSNFNSEGNGNKFRKVTKKRTDSKQYDNSTSTSNSNSNSTA